MIDIFGPAQQCGSLELVEQIPPSIPGSVAVRMVGSQYVLGYGSDVDFVALVASVEDTVQVMVDNGWALGSSDEYPTDTFKSLRCGDVNVMVTSSVKFYSEYVLASEVCKVLQLKNKVDRIRVHRVIMDGENAEQVWAIWGKPE